MHPWTKEIITKAIKADKPIKFVDTIKEVEELANKQIYGIEKDSTILKELIKDGIFPIDQRFLKLRKGHYYIINIIPQEIESKIGKKVFDIGIVIYKETENDKYWDKIYQVKLDPLFNFISKRKYTKAYNPYELIGRTIHIEDFKLIEEKKSYQVIWYDLASQERYISEIERIHSEQILQMEEGLEALYIQSDELSAMENAMEEEYLNSEDFLLSQAESELDNKDEMSYIEDQEDNQDHKEEAESKNNID